MTSASAVIGITATILSSGLRHSGRTSFTISLPIAASRSRRDGSDAPRRPACSDCSRSRKRSQHAEPLAPSTRADPVPGPGARAAPDPRPRAGPWGSPSRPPGRAHHALPRRTEPRDGSLPRNPLARQGPRCFPRFFPGRVRRAPAKQPGKPPAAGAAFAFPPCRARNPRCPPLALRAFGGHRGIGR